MSEKFTTAKELVALCTSLGQRTDIFVCEWMSKKVRVWPEYPHTKHATEVYEAFTIPGLTIASGAT